MSDSERWTILVYRIPPHPTRLRLAIWRRLQKMGALYLQDGVTLLPDRDDLTENVTYVAQAIREMEGECHLFLADSLLPGEEESLRQKFKEQAGRGMRDIATRLDSLEAALDDKIGIEEVEAIEETLQRERASFLRLSAIAHFGADEAPVLEQRLAALRLRITSCREAA